MSTEAQARAKIDNQLKQAGWRLYDDENGKANVDLEYSVKIKRNDKFKTFFATKFHSYID